MATILLRLELQARQELQARRMSHLQDEELTEVKVNDDSVDDFEEDEWEEAKAFFSENLLAHETCVMMSDWDRKANDVMMSDWEWSDHDDFEEDEIEEAIFFSEALAHAMCMISEWEDHDVVRGN